VKIVSGWLKKGKLGDYVCSPGVNQGICLSVRQTDSFLIKRFLLCKIEKQ